MRLTIWGSRGSIASAGQDTLRYGGNTACVEVEADHDEVVILDAGTGIRRSGLVHAGDGRPVHILLTHLHMDHIQGLGFFRPLFEPGRIVHIWGPPSTTLDLRTRLTRYLSPPLFPVRLQDLGSHVELHDAPPGPWRIGALTVFSDTVVHPGATVGYRLGERRRQVAYLPDHEPALAGFGGPRWTSGYDLANGVDVLLHDAQYAGEEYEQRVGWGHSSVGHAAALADLARVDRLLTIHHDPEHSDQRVDELLEQARMLRRSGRVFAASEGLTVEV
jgi:phosphoribosyl 1,2-cyclic phosphodiesterase